MDSYVYGIQYMDGDVSRSMMGNEINSNYFISTRINAPLSMTVSMSL
jgi:hypothetical protein